MPILCQKFAELLKGSFFILLILALCTAGILVINSATFTHEFLKDSYLAQFKYTLIGLGLFFFLAFTPYRLLVSLAPYLYALAIVLLIACFIPHIGKKVYGAYSWIRVGSFGLEPAEFAKIAFILGLAGLLTYWDKEIKSLKVVLGVLTLMAVPFILLALQPAYGSALVFLGITLGMLFASGTRLRYIIIPLVLTALALGGVYYWVIVKGWDIKIPGFKTTHVMDRIKVAFDPNLDPQGKAWQVNQSVIAISSGGLEGKGWRQGTQNVLGYLPKNTSYNDLIFSVLGEEQGFYGGCALIIGQGVLLLWCLFVASRTPDKLGALIAVGVMSMLFTHVFVNIGMTMRLVPIIGIPLPFISYGGTFLVGCLSAMGLVFSVWVHRKKYYERT